MGIPAQTIFRSDDTIAIFMCCPHCGGRGNVAKQLKRGEHGYYCPDNVHAEPILPFHLNGGGHNHG